MLQGTLKQNIHQKPRIRMATAKVNPGRQWDKDLRILRERDDQRLCAQQNYHLNMRVKPRHFQVSKD